MFDDSDGILGLGKSDENDKRQTGPSYVEQLYNMVSKRWLNNLFRAKSPRRCSLSIWAKMRKIASLNSVITQKSIWTILRLWHGLNLFQGLTGQLRSLDSRSAVRKLTWDHLLLCLEIITNHTDRIDSKPYLILPVPSSICLMVKWIRSLTLIIIAIGMNVLSKILENQKFAYHEDFGLYYVNCDQKNFQTVYLQLDGQWFGIHPSTYVLPVITSLPFQNIFDLGFRRGWNLYSWLPGTQRRYFDSRRRLLKKLLCYLRLGKRSHWVSSTPFIAARGGRSWRGWVVKWVISDTKQSLPETSLIC